MITKEYANRFLKPVKGKRIRIKKNYETKDIISEILYTDKHIALNCIEKFAKNLKFKSLNDLCQQLFDFLYYNVVYREDPLGHQYIKSPSALWFSKLGDCKSFSIFIASVFKALHIPYSYRFVSFTNSPVYTHVYPIAHGKKNNIIVDVVLKKYDKTKGLNEEKKYTFKKDYYMSGIYRIEGIGANDPTTLRIKRPLDEMSEGDLDLEIARQRLEIEKEIIAEKRGINSLKVAEYQNVINTLNGFIAAADERDFDKMEAIINGLGVNGVGVGFLKKAFKKIKKGVKAVVKVAKKVVKTAIKVVTFPLRLAAKAILTVTLPKAAPYFLYLFINKKEVLDKMPAKVKAKRKKSAKIADFIVEWIGMKRSNFMGIIRNSLMKKYKMSPEAYLSKMFGQQVSGIGIILDIIEAIFKIFKLFGKKADVTKNDIPDASDFAGLTPEQQKQLGYDVKNQPGAVEPGESIPSDGGSKAISKGICDFS